MNLNLKKYWLNWAYLLSALLFAYLYFSSDGFAERSRFQKVWYKDFWKLASGQPQRLWLLKRHFRQTLLFRLYSGLFTPQENQHFFSRWDKDVLEKEHLALHNIIKRRWREHQQLSRGQRTFTLDFVQLHQQGKLTTSGQLKIIQATPEGLKLQLEGSGDLFLLTDAQRLSALANSLILTYHTEQHIRAKLFWQTLENPEASELRRVSFTLQPDGNMAELDLHLNYQWLSEEQFEQLRFSFSSAAPTELTLNQLQLSWDVSPLFPPQNLEPLF